MKFLGILFVFFGYVLVYASVAAGGKFATDPWASLFADAYTDTGFANAQDVANAASKTLGGRFGTLNPNPPSPPNRFSRATGLPPISPIGP